MSFLNTGTGIQGNPYKIYTEDDLFELASYSGIDELDTWYQLQNDITLTKDWTPIGTSSKMFKGTFDGNFKTIKNVNIEGSISRLGFFGSVESALIKYLTIEGLTITATGGIQHGGLIGFANKSTIRGCKVKDVSITLPSNGGYTGGLIGGAGQSATTANTVYIYSTVVENLSIINGVEVTGGFIGEMYSAQINNSMLIGNLNLITGTSAFSVGNVRSTAYVKFNGFVTSITGSGANGNATNQSISNGTIKAVSNLRSKSAFTGIIPFGNTEHWDMVDGQLPHLTYYGTELNPVLISTYADITTKMMSGSFEYGLTGAYKLMNDISPITVNPAVSGRTNLSVMLPDMTYGGAINTTFSGILDGDGYAIKINSSASGVTSSYSVRLFKTLRNAVLKDLIIDWTQIWSSRYFGDFEMLANLAYSTLIENVTVKASRLYYISSVTTLPNNAEKSIFRNIYIEYDAITMTTPDTNYWIGFINRSNITDVKASEYTNIILMFKSTLGKAPIDSFKGIGAVSDAIISKINGVVIYANGFPAFTNSSSLPINVVPTLEDFRNGNNPVYASFKNSWIFSATAEPIQRAFVKVIEKIEQRLVKSHSSIIKTVLDRFKGKENLLQFFTKPVKSKTFNFKGVTKQLKSYGKSVTSGLFNTKKIARQSTSFSNKVEMQTFKFKSKLSEVKNYSKEIVTNLLNTKIASKMTSSFSGKLLNRLSTEIVKPIKFLDTGIGTKGNPYKLYTEDDLFDVQRYNAETYRALAFYQLQNDITLTKDWTPIGSYDRSFNGNFDGNGFKISNINIVAGTNDYQGFFGYLSIVQIKNLTLNGITITGSGDNYGALVGGGYGFTVDSCYVKNVNITDIGRNYHYHGGLVGRFSGANIKNTIVEDVTITGGNYLSGLVGSAYSSFIDNCLVLGDLSFVGDSSWSYLYSIGYVSNTVITLTAVQDSKYPSSSSLSDNTKVKQLSDPTDINEYITDINNDWNGKVWEFGSTETWNMVDGELPYLTYFGYSVDKSYELSTIEDLDLIVKKPDAFFKLMNNIPLSDVYETYVLDTSFSGELNGNGFSITNIEGSNDNIDTKFAFFKEIQGSVKNLGLQFNSISFPKGDVATFAETLNGGVLSNIRVTVDGISQGNTNYGFIYSILGGSITENCYMYVLDLRSSIDNYDNPKAKVIGSGLSWESTTEKNNIFYVETMQKGEIDTKSNTGPNTGGISENNIVYTGNDGAVPDTNGVAVTNNLEAFRNSEDPMYTKFDKENWVFSKDANPIQAIFARIIEKIEERLVKSFGTKVKSNARPSILIRALSYANQMLSKNIVSKLSDIYKFGKAVVSNSVRNITTESNRFKRIKVVSKFYVGKVTTFAKSIYTIDALPEVYAYVMAKFNKISLFKRENKTETNTKQSKTIINQKNNGGGD